MQCNTMQCNGMEDMEFSCEKAIIVVHIACGQQVLLPQKLDCKKVSSTADYDDDGDDEGIVETRGEYI